MPMSQVYVRLAAVAMQRQLGSYLRVGHAMADDGALQRHNWRPFPERFQYIRTDDQFSLHKTAACAMFSLADR